MVDTYSCIVLTLLVLNPFHVLCFVLQTDTTTAPTHSAETSTDKLALSIQTSSADMMLFSLAQIHVISRTSGFGQKAAFLSEFSSKHHIFFADKHKVCNLESYDQPDHVAGGWSGV